MVREQFTLGPLALAGAITLTVVATMQHDPRWLLWYAWPCFGVAIWWLARRTREILLISILEIGVAGGLLLQLSNWPGESQPVAASRTPLVPTKAVNPKPPESDSTQPPENQVGHSKAVRRVIPAPTAPTPLLQPENGETLQGV